MICLGQIINSKTTRSMQSLIWRKPWALPYVSPWGIFERFKMANNVTSKDIFDVFGTQDAKTHTRLKAHSDLVELKGLIQDKLQSVFGSDIFDTTQLLINNFISPLNQGRFNPEFIRKHVAFCQECINLGYHSIFHQYVLFDNCPIHQTRLKHLCPECSRTIWYELSREVHTLPFHCKCGFPLGKNIRSTRFSEIWSQDDFAMSVQREIRIWLTLDQKSINLASKLIIFPNSWVEGKGREVLLGAQSIIGTTSLLSDQYKDIT